MTKLAIVLLACFVLSVSSLHFQYLPRPGNGTYPGNNNNNYYPNNNLSCNPQNNGNGQVTATVDNGRRVTFTFNGPFTYQCVYRQTNQLLKRQSCSNVCDCASMFNSFVNNCPRDATIVKTVP